MYKKRIEQTHSHIQKRTVVIIALAVILLTVGGVFAKYIHSNNGTNVLAAKEFYFCSNLLTENTAKYVLNSTAKEISFTLGNNEDKLRYSQDTIKYTVTVESKGGGNAPTVQYQDETKELQGGSVNSTTITLSDLKSGETYIVTAVGEAGYRQTLTAEFTVSDKDENVYKHLDTSNDAFVLLTVWTENIKGDLTIKVIEPGLIPDNTDPVLRKVYNYQNGSYGTINGEHAIVDNINYINGYSSYTYRFFLSKNSSYSVADFEVFIENNDTKYLAEEEEPQ